MQHFCPRWHPVGMRDPLLWWADPSVGWLHTHFKLRWTCLSVGYRGDLYVTGSDSSTWSTSSALNHPHNNTVVQSHHFTWTDPDSRPALARSRTHLHGNSHSEAVFLASSSVDTHLFCSFLPFLLPLPPFLSPVCEGNLVVPVRWEDLGFVVSGVSLKAEQTGDSDRTWRWKSCPSRTCTFDMSSHVLTF